jgi:chitin disaccharide deacetylase
MIKEIQMIGPKMSFYFLVACFSTTASLVGQDATPDTTKAGKNSEIGKAAAESPGQRDFTANSGSIQVVMRADDFGFSNAANSACIKGYKEGIITSVEVLVPGPWFLAAADLLKENRGLDAGVHLALTCEWDNYKWEPLTGAPGLLTDAGFLPVTNDDFKNLNFSLNEVERELRAQINLALKTIPHVSHLSTHMAAPTATEELRQLIERLSREYRLPLEPVGVNRYSGMWGEPIEQKEEYLARCLNDLQSGLTVFVCHLALNNQETQAIKGSGHDAMERMAMHRQAETDAVTSKRIKQIIKNRHIKLVSYADTFASNR